jgi:UDP-N-acetylmuramoyl-L-alanyl-D-glutamate--2,6-diaminopimelate ligase
MRLAEVLDSLDDAELADVDVRDVQIDSRQCGPGSLYFAMPGASTDGALFIEEAIDRGAVAVVAPSELDVEVPLVVVRRERLHGAMVAASSTVVGHPERDLILAGVTGTNGKTSVTTVLAGLWRALGHGADVIGTLTHERTTPAPPELYRELRRLASHATDDERPLMAIEVSSHAIDQGRVDGVVFDVAVFTNLSHDHLDYHGSMEEYFAVKMRLFAEDRCRRAVVLAEGEWGERAASIVRCPLTRVRRSEASDVVASVRGTSLTWRSQRVDTRLVGGYNVDNALLAMTAAVELGAGTPEVAGAMSSVTGVPGRFEILAAHPVVVVDYAHSPDGLARLLGDVRDLAPTSRIIVVFGCGGDRDRHKRPVMGRVASELADLSIFTSDNPRREDPEAIIDEIAAGAGSPSRWRREADRRQAIALALSEAGPDDVVVVAGKGAERTQVFGDRSIEFDDRVVVAELIG